MSRRRTRNTYTEREGMGSPEGRPNPYLLGVVALSALLFLLRGVYVLLARLRLRNILNEVTAVVKTENSFAFSIYPSQYEFPFFTSIATSRGIL